MTQGLLEEFARPSMVRVRVSKWECAEKNLTAEEVAMVRTVDTYGGRWEVIEAFKVPAAAEMMVVLRLKA